MPQLRAEQLRELTLKDNRIANDANIKQHKIENWQSDPAGWISKGIIKPVTTANLPQWDGSQAGQMYYDINTNELFIGITTAPYFQLIAGAGIGDGAFSDRILVVKMSADAENWSGSTPDDVSGTASIFALDTDKVAADGSNLLVYLNGMLQERGSGNDYVLFSENDVDKIQFTYNVEGPEQKVTAVINNDARLVNYATKSYVDEKFFGQSGHDHDGIDSNQLDINTAIKATSLAALINSIIPSSPAVNLGSPTNKFGKIYAEEGHFDANTIYLGGVALSGAGDTLMLSKDGGTTYVEVPVSGSTTEPATLVSGAGQQVVLESSSGIIAKGNILPDVTLTRDIGSSTNKFNKIYAEEVFVGASSLYVNGKKVIEDVSNEMTFRTSTDQAMMIKTTSTTPGVGNANLAFDSGNELNVIAHGGMEFNVPNSSSKHVNFVNNSTNGNITLETVSANGQIQLTSNKEIILGAPIVSAASFTGNLLGNASTATKLAATKTITLNGDVTGSVDFDGSGNVLMTTTVANDSHTHDDRYFTESESNARYVYKAGDTVTGDLTISGNLIVNGTTTTVNTTELAITDNTVVLNKNQTGTPSSALISGIEIERGDSVNYQFMFRESDDAFVIGVTGSLQAVATRQDTPTANAIPYWNATINRFDSSGVTVSGSTLTGSLSGNASSATLAATATVATSANQVRGVNFHADTTDPTATTRLNMDGYFYATRVYNAVYNDLAEFMTKADDAEPGMVLVQTPDGVAPSSSRGDGAVVGVCSDTYGYALGADDSDNKVPVGLSGRVNVWIEEPCKIGDLLITSDKIGFATVKRSSEDGIGKIFAKVLENKEDTIPQRISVLIMIA